MYKGKTVCIVVPAYNEERQIGRVLETMPEYVDKVVVVDDKSTDKTVEVVRGYARKFKDKIVLIQHRKNEGPGGAIASGYEWARDNNFDITAVMAGDAQMDPQELPLFLDVISSGEVDYAKGNRLFTGRAWEIFPKARYLGSAVLSLLTK
ncbi:MAG: glycosyltransferase family 2 protein, partial [Candidatus Cloacimonadota bacterium]